MFFRWIAAALIAAFPHAVSAQSTGSGGWHVMQDAVVYGLFNHQGGPRGGDELRVPNWWMGMFERKVGSSNLTINTMLSLDPLTVGKKGYRELFQVGEAFEGKPLIDYQHPHDVFMQLALVWRMPIGTHTGFTLAGGPSAEPALGPVAFMHRASAMENPMSPLAHHTLDSTHIAFGVVTAAVDHGPWMIEASAFNGREPDEDRWDFDFGPLDSFSGATVVSSACGMGVPILVRPAEEPRGARPRHHRPNDSLRVMAEAGRREFHGGHRGLWPQQRRRRGPRRAAARSDETFGTVFDLRPPRVRRGRNRRCCSTTDSVGHDVKDMVTALTLGVRPRAAALVEVRDRHWRRRDVLRRARSADADARHAPRLVPGVLPPAPGARGHGTDVEHAHDQADASGRDRPACRASDAVRRINA